MKKPSSRAGFTLIELVVVILILAVLAGVLVPRVTNHMASSRDARRLADVKTIRDAIEQYYLDEGSFPRPKRNNSYGGWDVSHDGDFIPELVEKGYLREPPRDPVNDKDHQYRYFVYKKGSYGCVGDGDFYVLGIRSFETGDFGDKNPGYFKCSQRNWSKEFAYVTGGGASTK